MADPDMLEHADRDDAVISTSFMPIVPKQESHLLGDFEGLGAPLRVGLLLGRQRQAGDIGSADTSERKHHSALRRSPASNRAAYGTNNL
jgi:hypothetical protein